MSSPRTPMARCPSRTMRLVLLLEVLAPLIAHVTPANHTSPRPAAVYYTEWTGNPLQTVWGHDASAGGAARVSKEALSRLDLLQELRLHSGSEACRSALDSVLEARMQLKLWAIKMHAASVTLPEALITGTTFDLGDYDACLSVPEAMYCIVDVEVRPDPSSTAASAAPHYGDESSPYTPPHGHNATTWDLLMTSGNQRRFRRDDQQWAVCVPAACGSAAGQLDVRLLGGALADALSPMARQMAVELRLHVNGRDCATAGGATNTLRQRLNDPVFVILSFIILSFPLLSIIATIREAVKRTSKNSCDVDWDADPGKDTGWISSFLNCFAVQRVWKCLLRKDESQIRAIQGMRTITMFCIILGHRCYVLMAGALQNPEFFEEAFMNPMGSYLVAGTIVVSSFFVISGFLFARSLMTTMNKHGENFNIFVVLRIFKDRYFRLVPALAVMLAVEAQWVPLMGSGPLWPRGVGRASHDCSKAWWRHLLLIHNYFNWDASLCLIQTWYVSADFQMHLVTPLVMWLVYKMTRRSVWPGLSFLICLLLVFCFVLYANALYFELDAMTHIFPQIMRSWNNWNGLVYPTFGMQHVPAHTNAIPYILGLISGTLFFLTKHHKWQIPKWLGRTLTFGIPVGTLLQIATLVSCMLLFTPAFEQTEAYLGLLYGPARVLGFTMPTAWVIYASGMDFGGIFDGLLTWTPSVVLGQLNYSVFLVHISLIEISAGILRQPQHLSVLSLLLAILSDLLASYLLGLLFYLIVEAPLANLQKKLK